MFIRVAYFEIPRRRGWGFLNNEYLNGVEEGLIRRFSPEMNDVLKCKPNDLLRHVVGAEDEALLTLIGGKDETSKPAAKKASKKGSPK